MQTGRFGSQGGIPSELMHRERKIAKDQAHTRMILFYQLIEKRGEIGAGRALEITEFFQRNRSLRVAANVHRFGIAFSRDALVFGDGKRTGQLCAIEHRSAPQRGDRRHANY